MERIFLFGRTGGWVVMLYLYGERRKGGRAWVLG